MCLGRRRRPLTLQTTNPLPADERHRKRQELLAVTEREVETVAVAIRSERRSLRGKETIGMRVGKVISRYKVAKTFDTTDHR